MKIHHDYHLTYCTNVHPAQNWQESFDNLKAYALPLKERISPNLPFGIGLWLSDQAAKELLNEDHLETFRIWLEEKRLYVFTMNGFPFGTFHGTKVKDQVHQPDWSTKERLQYTLNLIEILGRLLPADVDSGSISTSPVSYKLWGKNLKNSRETPKAACRHFGIIAEHLYRLKKEKQINIHVAVEPEPDGLIESCAEALDFFKTELIPEAGAYIQKKLSLTFGDAKNVILEHIRLCYDICHSALLYEEPENELNRLQAAGIKIGKVQISSAIKVVIGKDQSQRQILHDQLMPFADSVYLHQVIGRKADGSLEHYPDLAPALEKIFSTKAEEWRIHFHVPVFVEHYINISSTRKQIEKAFEHLTENKFTRHLEIETYTWEVLPPHTKSGLVDSIEREYQWVLEKLDQK